MFRFIETRYPERVGGKLRLGPLHSLETFHGTFNPLPIVAGMNAVLDRLLALPEGRLTPAETTSLAASRALVPPLPLQTPGDKTVFAPAQEFTNQRPSTDGRSRGGFQ